MPAASHDPQDEKRRRGERRRVRKREMIVSPQFFLQGGRRR
jgi:hypothetical protein